MHLSMLRSLQRRKVRVKLVLVEDEVGDRTDRKG